MNSMIWMMTILVLKVFTSFSRNRLFFMPASARAFLIKISPLGEISYKVKKADAKHFTMKRFASAAYPLLSFLK